MNTLHYTIIGGGIAGLSAGLALSQSGASATIYEQAAKFDAVGAGLQLGPNAVRALQALGAWDAVSPFTYAPPAIHIRDGFSGRLLQAVELGSKFTSRFGLPYLVAHRADVHAGLWAAVKLRRNIALNLNQAVSYTQIIGPIIGADGINSATRLGLFPESAALPVPEKIYRALLPMPNLRGIAIECVNLWLFAQGHVVHYPVSGGKKFNLVAVTKGKAPLEHFAASAPELRNIIALAPGWLEWPGAYVPPLPRWGQGSLCLIGDAAHATLPFLAQGAAMALEDAVVLGQTKTNLSAYEALRRTRVSRLHHETLRNGTIYHLQGMAAQARNAALRAMPQSLSRNRLAWIYEY